MRLVAAKETVIILPVAEQKTKSGLKIPQMGKERPRIGEVFDVGSGEAPIEMKPGDRIVYRQYAENPVTIGEREYNFIKFEDIVGIVYDE